MAARRVPHVAGRADAAVIEKINDMNKWLSTAGDVAVFVSIYGVSQYLPSLASALWGDAAGGSMAFALKYMAGGVLTIVLVGLYRRLVCRTCGRIGRSRRGFDPAFLLWGIVLLAAVSIVVEPLSDLLPAVDRSYGRDGWIMLSAVVVAPVVEEVLFRGMLFDMIRSRAGLAAAFLLSSLVFAVMHLQPAVMAVALPSGMVLCYAYIKTRSIFSCILLHMMNNALAMALNVLQYRDRTISELLGSSSGYFILYALALAVTVAGGFGIARTLRNGRKSRKNAPAL